MQSLIYIKLLSFFSLHKCITFFFEVHLLCILLSHLSPPSLLSLFSWWVDLAMHFTSESVCVAMVVARDLSRSDVKSPNIKGVLLMRRGCLELLGMSNCLAASTHAHTDRHPSPFPTAPFIIMTTDLGISVLLHKKARKHSTQCA